MLYICNDSKDPHYNLALEEYVLKNLNTDQAFIMLWQNQPSVIIGRFQNTIEEINIDYIRKNNIHVVRRITGGGAVYHDLGNLNFTFIENKTEEGLDFRKYTERIAKALDRFGIKAEISARNDITIDGKKFSGNAQYVYKNRVLHHGTILYNSDLDAVLAALNVSGDKIESKGIKSIRSRVTNVIDYMQEKVSLEEFKTALIYYLFDSEPGGIPDDTPSGVPYEEYILSEEDLARIKELMVEKYVTWEWNHGSSPSFNFRNKERFACGTIEVRLKVEKGIIQTCKIYGDFFSYAEIGDFEKMFEGIRYEEGAIKAVLNRADLSSYFGPVAADELLKCFLA